MKAYDTYFIDLDGTTYKGKQRIPAAARFIDRLQAKGKQIVFLTNNSTRTPEYVANNLTNNHNIKVEANNIYTTALATADYLAQHAKDKRRVFMIGESGLRAALESRGFDIVDNNPDFVVVGLDTQVNYEKFQTAVLAIQAGAVFIGTNADSNLPNEKGLVPGAGSLVALVQYATQQKPIMIGKPETIIMDMARQKYHAPVDDVIMVGDNYNTDILAGIRDGIDTLLVYTGFSSPEDITHVKIKPTYEVNSLDEWQVL